MYVCVCVCVCVYTQVSLMAQQVKNLTMQETHEMQVQSLGQEHLEKEMATHSSILA